MTYLDLEGFADWVRPASARLDCANLKRYDGLASALNHSGADDEELVLAAHNAFPGRLLNDLESGISSQSADYEPGRRRALVSRLAGAVLIHRMVGDADAGVCLRARAALNVRSASFVGLRPVIPELRRVANDCLLVLGTESRARVAPTPWPAPKRTRKRQTPAVESEAETLVTPDALRAELAKRDAALKTLNKRLDELAGRQFKHLECVDEELDALWWSRSDRSWMTGDSWALMDPLDRAVLAGREVADLIRRVPAARAHERLICSTVADNGATYDLEEVASALARNPRSVEPPLVGDGRSVILRPLAAMEEVAHRAGETRDRPSALRAAIAVEEPWRRTATDVALQLLVERCLEMSAS